MAGGINQSGGRGRFQPVAEINVTPMVDVMLVLLIIFMVAAPLLTVGVAVDLPETSAEALTDQGEPLTVSVLSDGTIFLQDTEVSFDNLAPRLLAISQAGYEQRIYVQGDKAAAYDDVAKVIGELNSAGFTRIGLVTE